MQQRFDLSDAWSVFFRDTRFTEQARYKARHAAHTYSGAWSLGSIAEKFANQLIVKLRDGEPPIVKVSASMRAAGLDEELERWLLAELLQFAGEHVRQISAAASREKEVLSVLDAFNPQVADDGDAEDLLSEMFGS